MSNFSMFVASFLFVLSLISGVRSTCTATASVSRSSQSWDNNSTIYTITVVNTGTIGINSVELSIQLSSLSVSIVNKWNLDYSPDDHLYTISNFGEKYLFPSAASSGSGFIISTTSSAISVNIAVVSVFCLFSTSDDLHDNQVPSTVWQNMTIPAHASHRGGFEVYAPENTMYSYMKAVYESKTNIIEMDLRLTTDGVIVLHHLDSIATTSNGLLLVTLSSLSQLRQYDFAYWYTPDGTTYPLRGKGITIPTLEEVIDEFVETSPHLVFHFDIKTISVIQPALQKVKERGIQNRVIFDSAETIVNREVLDAIASFPVHIPVACDLASLFALYAAYKTGTFNLVPIPHDILIIPYDNFTSSHMPGIISQDFFDALHGRQKKIIVYGTKLDQSQEEIQMIEEKADIILTNRPDVLRLTMDEYFHNHSFIQPVQKKNYCF